MTSGAPAADRAAPACGLLSAPSERLFPVTAADDYGAEAPVSNVRDFNGPIRAVQVHVQVTDIDQVVVAEEATRPLGEKVVLFLSSEADRLYLPL